MHLVAVTPQHVAGGGVGAEGHNSKRLIEKLTVYPRVKPPCKPFVFVCSGKRPECSADLAGSLYSAT